MEGHNNLNPIGKRGKTNKFKKDSYYPLEIVVRTYKGAPVAQQAKGILIEQ